MFRLNLVLLIVTIFSWMAFILISLGQPSEDTLFLTEGYRESRTIFGEFIAIGAHLGLFGILGVFLYITICNVTQWPVKHLDLLAISLIGGGWGALTELYQLGVPGRYASVGDVITDLIGAAVGGLLTRGAMTLVSRRNYKSDL